MGVKVSWNTPRLTTVLPVTEFVKTSLTRWRTRTLMTSPASSKKTVPLPVPVVVRAISKPSHWRKSGTESSSVNRSSVARFIWSYALPPLVGRTAKPDIVEE